MLCRLRQEDWESETSLVTQLASGQPWLHRETLSQNTNQTKPKNFKKIQIPSPPPPKKRRAMKHQVRARMLGSAYNILDVRGPENTPGSHHSFRNKELTLVS
jgi:hypothetical protein